MRIVVGQKLFITLATSLASSLVSSTALIGIACASLLVAVPVAAQDVDDWLNPVAKPQLERSVGPFTPGDLRKSEAQREKVAELARQRLGVTIGSSTATDLAAIQRLLDERHVGSRDVFLQQSLGVVLGDALDRDLRILQWAVVDDSYGHSRALQYRTTDQVYFPVTMISKRIELGEPVDVRALYEQVKTAAEALEVNREEHLRRSRGRR